MGVAADINNITEKLNIEAINYDMMERSFCQSSPGCFGVTAAMESSFIRTFAPVFKVVATGGFLFPGSDILYRRFPRTVKLLICLMFVCSQINFITEIVNEAVFMAKNKAEGLTDLFMILAFGVASPTYIFTAYAYTRRLNLKRIVEIWEKEMTNPPFPEDRKAEIANTQRYLFRIVKAQIYCFMIPLTLWSSRTIITKEPILPVVYSGDITKSPAFEIVIIFFGYFGFCLAATWGATENIKLMFMKNILAELNHLKLAAKKILTFKFDADDTEKMKPLERDEELAAMRKNLRTWIVYHQTVLRFSDEVISFTAPVIFIQEMAAITFAFAGAFIVILGSVPLSTSASGLCYMLFYYYVMYVTNSLGDEIRIKSASLMDTFNGREYYRYTKDIIKDVSLVQYVTLHRPINLRSNWYKNLSRRSLAEITRKGYEMIAFMSHLVQGN